MFATQAYWLFLLPCLWVLVSDTRARQAFVARQRAAEELPAEERAWWAGLVLPPLWLLPTLVMPAVAVALWRVAMLMLAASS